SRVVLPAASGLLSLLVTAPEPSYVDVGVDSRYRTGKPFALDETAKYFLVLVALCEPQLTDPWSMALPSAPEIVRRLRPLTSCRVITRAAVNFHVDYLARHKLRVRQRRAGAPVAKADWQRAALVSLALRFGLVHSGHLALLPDPHRLTQMVPVSEKPPVSATHAESSTASGRSRRPVRYRRSGAA
ncbi:MAG: hypothetical protein ACRD0P_36700, partial [Stackebrandtia sp.]